MSDAAGALVFVIVAALLGYGWDIATVSGMHAGLQLALFGGGVLVLTWILFERFVDIRREERLLRDRDRHYLDEFARSVWNSGVWHAATEPARPVVREAAAEACIRAERRHAEYQGHKFDEPREMRWWR